MKNEVLRIMKENGLKFNKSLGQNFLIDTEVLQAIVNDVAETDSILEIGAGLGILTNKLLEKTANVTAIEFDSKLAKYLQKNTKANIIRADILKVNLKAVIEENNINKIIANLPYYITSPIIMRILEEIKVESAKLMVQYEVAKRIVAKEGSKDYGILSIACQYYAEIAMLLKVPSSSFLPAPKVDSAVINLKIREKSPIVSDKKAFFCLVKAAFAQRRKTFVNSVSNSLNLDKTIIQKVLGKLNREENVRAEQLSMEEFDKLTQLLYNFLNLD